MITLEQEPQYFAFRALGFDIERAAALARGDNMQDSGNIDWRAWAGLAHTRLVYICQCDFWQILLYEHTEAQQL